MFQLKCSLFENCAYQMNFIQLGMSFFKERLYFCILQNILAQACQNETQEVAKRQRLDTGDSVATAFHVSSEHHTSKVSNLQKVALSNTRAQKGGHSICFVLQLFTETNS